MGRVAVGGALAQRPGYGGHAWALLNYLLGFRELGHEVLFLDRLDAGMAPSSQARDGCVRWLDEVMRGAGLGDSYSLFIDEQADGLSRRAVVELVRDANLLLDIDPGFGQMWRELGLHDSFRGHDAFVTVGEGIGEDDCLIPTCGIEWVTTPHPIVLGEWPAAEGGSRFTSVGSSRGPYEPVEYYGHRFGLRAHELRKLIDLPSLVEPELELALDIDPFDGEDREALLAGGWTLVDPAEVAADSAAYRRYVQGSLAELMVPKGIYAEARSGWFSERSIAYLASGKPVLAGETGFARRYPTGEGLISFSSLDEARAGVEAIWAEPGRHARAAREIAAEHFEAKRVLGRLLEQVAA